MRLPGGASTETSLYDLASRLIYSFSAVAQSGAFDSEPWVATTGEEDEILSDGLEFGMSLREIEPFPEDGVGLELGELGLQCGMVIVGRAGKYAIPRFLAVFDGEDEAAVKVGSIEIEEALPQEARIILQRLKEPEEGIGAPRLELHGDGV
jgi:hypothetical protein